MTWLLFDLSASRFAFCSHFYLLSLCFCLLTACAILHIFPPLLQPRVPLENSISSLHLPYISLECLLIFTQNLVLICYSKLLSFTFCQHYNMNTCNFLYCSATNGSPDIYMFMCVSACVCVWLSNVRLEVLYCMNNIYR